VTVRSQCDGASIAYSSDSFGFRVLMAILTRDCRT